VSLPIHMDRQAQRIFGRLPVRRGARGHTTGSNFLYGLQPNDTWTLGTAAATLRWWLRLLDIFPLAGLSRLDPMTALREE
jgi:hypothetical protein